MVAVDDSFKSVPVPVLVPSTTDELRRHKMAQKRKQARLSALS
jgi:acyl-CoA hydrolase